MAPSSELIQPDLIQLSLSVQQPDKLFKETEGSDFQGACGSLQASPDAQPFSHASALSRRYRDHTSRSRPRGGRSGYRMTRLAPVPEGCEEASDTPLTSEPDLPKRDQQIVVKRSWFDICEEDEDDFVVGKPHQVIERAEDDEEGHEFVAVTRTTVCHSEPLTSALTIWRSIPTELWANVLLFSSFASVCRLSAACAPLRASCSDTQHFWISYRGPQSAGVLVPAAPSPPRCFLRPLVAGVDIMMVAKLVEAQWRHCTGLAFNTRDMLRGLTSEVSHKNKACSDDSTLVSTRTVVDAAQFHSCAVILIQEAFKASLQCSDAKLADNTLWLSFQADAQCDDNGAKLATST